MLQVVEGDLWAGATGKCVIAHGCNSLGVMGAGFAAQLRVRYPLAFLEYRSMCLNNRIKVGTWQIVHENDKAITHLITQETYGNDPDVVYVDYDAVEKGMKVVQTYCRLYGQVAHFPLIGGGLAHGDTGRLMEIFERIFKHTDAVLHLLPSTKRH